MKKIFVIIVLLFFSSRMYAQYLATDTRHFIKIESGYFINYLNPSDDPDALQFSEDGQNINLVFGWDFDEKKVIGVGAGYLSLDDSEGINVFSEVNFYVSNGYVNPYLGAKIGYAIVWPPNIDGEGSILAEFLTGIKIRLGLYSYPSLYVQSGLLYTENTLYLPLRLGFSF